MGPLNGYRILDFTQAEALPLCTQILADLGAEVIKLEPAAGDASRGVGAKKKGFSTAYTTVNRGKKSMLMDLEDAQQKALFLTMVRTADAVVTDAAPGTMQALGVGFETLREQNPRIVLTDLTPFGLTGPMKDEAADDMTILAWSGLMSMVGDLGGQPLRVGTNIADTLAAFYACIGTLAALYAVQTTGVGREVDVSRLDSVFAAMEAAVIRYDMVGAIPKPQGNKHPSTVPFGNYACSDGNELIVNITTDDQFAKFVSALDAPELAEGELKLAADRLAQREKTEQIISGLFAKFDSDTLRARFDAANTPYGVINEVDMIAASEHMEDHKMLVDVRYPDGTVLRCAASPLKMTGMDAPQTQTASPLGYDTIQLASEYLPAAQVHAIYDEALGRIGVKP